MSSPSSKKHHDMDQFTGNLQPHSPRVTLGHIDPGPGAYEATQACGDQSESARRSHPRYGFGTAPREQYTRSYLSKAHQAKNPQVTTKNVDFMEANSVSSLAKQNDSRMPSAPAFGFGTSPRSQYEKQFFTSRHQSKMPNSTTQAVDFLKEKSATCLTSQSDSRKRTAPSFGFGHASRDGYERQFFTKNHQSKMPIVTTKDVDYMPTRGLTDSMASQVVSNRRSNPQYGFSKAPRTQYLRTFITKNHQEKMPTVTTASVDFMGTKGVTSMATQNDSRRRTAASYGFGTSVRDQYEHQFLTKSHQQKMVKHTTSGVDYITKESMGRMVSSENESSPSFGFGTSLRAHRDKLYMSPQ